MDIITISLNCILHQGSKKQKEQLLHCSINSFFSIVGNTKIQLSALKSFAEGILALLLSVIAKRFLSDNKYQVFNNSVVVGDLVFKMNAVFAFPTTLEQQRKGNNLAQSLVLVRNQQLELQPSNRWSNSSDSFAAFC